MQAGRIIEGFSKLSKSEKLAWLREEYGLSEQATESILRHLHPDPELQSLYSEISENNLSNFILPLGLAPNFLINGDLFVIPMVTEESSVVAAASHAAKFWARHGGFHAEVRDVLKMGQVHFSWTGSRELLFRAFEQNRPRLIRSVGHLTGRMQERGGGIETVEIRETGKSLPGSYQLMATFRTANAMGANFINSVLEAMAAEFHSVMEEIPGEGEVEMIMSILSNYTPDCLVQCSLEADPSVFESFSPGMSGPEFARKFILAVDIARQDPYRAVTHNKGIFNGMDAVIIATGNDFRAVEACGHAYASRSGQYGSLSRAELSSGRFSLTLEVPMAVGTVGGLTVNHPLASACMEILGRPSSVKLMQIIAAAGLASNFSAVRSLITTGIQRGHMKMHLRNILRQLNATREEAEQAVKHFENKSIFFTGVASFLESLRNQESKE